MLVRPYQTLGQYVELSCFVQITSFVIRFTFPVHCCISFRVGSLFCFILFDLVLPNLKPYCNGMIGMLHITFVCTKLA